jgi:glycosyltransferase involved in cell wall biosynthesis
LKIAFVHEWFVTYAGSEKVLSEMIKEFPDADIFCLVDFSKGKFASKFLGKTFRTSALQIFRFFPALYRNLLPLMAIAVEQFDLSGYDIVISNSHAFAKGVITGPDQLHICYCYTPMRYAWDMQDQYLRDHHLDGVGIGWLVRLVLHRLRIWDSRTPDGVDHFIACSGYIGRRIKRVYRRQSDVIYPGVDTDYFNIGQNRSSFYFTSSRLVGYKKILLIVEAFKAMPDKRLVVIGDGPQYKEIVKAAGDNVSVMGFQNDQVLLDHLQTAKAFIFAAEEDFGIAPLEAQACGTPVLAFGRGGGSETVIDGVTGLHFWTQTTESICDAVERFETSSVTFDPATIRRHAERFSIARFRAEFKAKVEAYWQEHLDCNPILREAAGR